MHNFTLVELSQTLLAIAALLFLAVPPGFLLAWWINLRQFRQRGAPEQLLWTLALSLPLNLFVANLVGRYLHQPWLLGCLLVLALSGITLWGALYQRRALPPWQLDRTARLVIAWIAGGVLYLLLAGMPLQIGHRLFEPAFSSDWEIRLPLIQAAARDGVPPHNPFFTFQGSSPPSRYYYYWFTLCAQVMHLVHTDARSTLIASAVYAGLCLVAVLFLCLKYLQPADGRLRQRCLLLLGLFLVLGLDVLPSLVGLVVWHIRLRAEMEWWLPDRSPGPLGALLYAPHHVAGATCGLLLTLLLASVAAEVPRPRLLPLLRYGLVVVLLFTALAGTSTYIAMFFGLFAAVYAVLTLLQGRISVAILVAGAGCLSLAISIPYLHELVAKTVTATDAHTTTHLLSFRVRHYFYAQWVLVQAAHRLHLPPPFSWRRYLYRFWYVLGLFFAELGFYLFVLIVQFQHDRLNRERRTPERYVLWWLAGCVGLFYLFVTSAGVQGVNDLGVHAGFVLRLIYMLWGAQVLAWFLSARKGTAWTSRQRLWIRLATACLILGICSTVWQATAERTYLILVNDHVVQAAPPFAHAHQLASVYYDVHAAQSAVAKDLPYDAVVQSNPTGVYQTIFRLYQQRRQAAGDISCEGSFGGDPAVCRSYVLDVLRLFGTRPPVTSHLPLTLSTPADRTVDALGVLCRRIGLAAVAVSSADPVWYDRQSWVWQGHPLYQSTHVRTILCPSIR